MKHVRAVTARVRPARLQDAPALGAVMVESWLAAHREHIPDVAWQARVTEWTPRVSARGWTRQIADISGAEVPLEVLLVAEGDGGLILGLVHGVVDGTASGQISSLYVAPLHHRQGIGDALLRAAAGFLMDLGVVVLRVSVLTANLPARRFYEVMGGLEVGLGSTEEQGFMLPTTVYEWSDASVLDAN